MYFFINGICFVPFGRFKSPKKAFCFCKYN